MVSDGWSSRRTSSESVEVAEAVAAEMELLDPVCRADPERFARRIAPDFHEFGASGCEFNSSDVIESVLGDSDGVSQIEVENVRGWLIADGVVLVKYTSVFGGKRVHRTSLWRNESGTWQVFHHQGTPSLD
ncbi:MAG: nuclear transport factor 2 family protein [Nocardiaceae bacterium]|nr:nuclear transport factor 2 family protein [Nocardiaceae bacterium]